MLRPRASEPLTGYMRAVPGSRERRRADAIVKSGPAFLAAELHRAALIVGHTDTHEDGSGVAPIRAARAPARTSLSGCGGVATCRADRVAVDVVVRAGEAARELPSSQLEGSARAVS